MEDLRKARAEHNLDRRMKVYLAPKVLVVDEFGIWPYDRESATAFFTLVSARYERGSILLLHHSHVLNIRGESYRLREKRQRGYSPHNNTSPQRRRRPATTTYTDRIAEQQRGGSISTCYKRVSSKLLLTLQRAW